MNRYWSVLILILVVAGAVRFHALGAKNLWLDESFSWRLQSFPVGMLIARTAEPTTVHPPLYFILLRQWAHLFGDSEFSLRALSATAGVAGVLAMFFFVFELVQYWTGGLVRRQDVFFAALLSCGVLALNAFHVQLGQEVRGYTMGILLGILTSYMLLRALRLESTLAWLSYACLALAFCYTHTLAVFSLAAQGYFAAFFLLRNGFCTRALELRAGPRLPETFVSDKPKASEWRGPCLAIVVVVGGYLPWLPQVLSQSETYRRAWIGSVPVLQDYVSQITQAILFTSGTGITHDFTLAWAVVVLLIGCKVFVLTRMGWAGLYLLCLGFVPVLLNFAIGQFSDRPIFLARYFAFAQPFWLASFICVVVSVPFRSARLLASGIVLVWSGFSYIEAYPRIGTDANPGMRAATAFILENRSEDELVVSETAFEFFKLAYYLRRVATPVLCVKEPGREMQLGSSHLLDSDLATQRMISQRLSRGIWIVTSDSFGRAPTRVVLSEGWKLVNEREFVQDYWLERPLLVRQYRISPHASREPGKSR